MMHWLVAALLLIIPLSQAGSCEYQGGYAFGVKEPCLTASQLDADFNAVTIIYAGGDHYDRKIEGQLQQQRDQQEYQRYCAVNGCPVEDGWWERRNGYSPRLPMMNFNQGLK